jgi:hypothetical protein
VLQRLECGRACALYDNPQVKQQITQNNDLYRQNAQEKRKSVERIVPVFSMSSNLYRRYNYLKSIHSKRRGSFYHSQLGLSSPINIAVKKYFLATSGTRMLAR